MRRWKWGLLGAVFIGPCLPLAFGYLHNQSVVDDAVGELKMATRGKGRPLDYAWDVEKLSGGCEALVAVSFATDRPRGSLNLTFNRPTPQIGLAWSEADRHVAERPIGQRSASIEAPVQRLLDQWYMNVDDKQRMVISERVAVPNGLDPRCW